MKKKEAISRAKLLLNKMETKGWKIRVWENLGWHYELINQTISITDEDSLDTRAMLCPHYSFWEVTHCKNPNMAVKGLLKDALDITLSHLDIILKGRNIN